VLETSGCETNLCATLIHGTATTHPEKKTHPHRKMQQLPFDYKRHGGRPMPSQTSCFLLIALLCLPSSALATTIHRCEASNGHITFTTMSCAAGERFEHQLVRPFTPGSVVAILPDAYYQETEDTSTKRTELTVIGQPEEKCANGIDAKQRREAIINQRVVAGMSQQDVESALGKPNKISIRNSATRYHYEPKRGRSANVEFDEKGCVKGKAKSQTAKSPR
jgi:hypothetical protein